MPALQAAAGWARVRTLFPGVCACFVAAAAATEQASEPPPGRCQAGIEYSARQLLRFGVALLGLRITAGQVAALGRQPVAIVVVSVVLTIAASMLAARLLGFQALFGLLSGGAVAICGFEPGQPRSIDEMIAGLRADHERMGAVLESIGFKPE